MNFEKIIDAWRKAAIDLNIQVHSPFILKTSDGTELKFELMIEKFGRKSGTLINSMENMENFKTAAEYGYHCTGLNPDSYSVYDRKHFIDTLNDMGYFGDEIEKPVWYSGDSWT